MERYLIFGGTGSLGKKLIQRLTSLNHNIAVYSRDEMKQWTLKNELTNDVSSKVKFFVGDIRDINRVKDVIRQFEPTIVIIAAALKQVDTCELSPGESISTNLLGTQNVISVVNDLELESLHTVLFVSTDKACAPVNVYGMCKAVSERVVTSQAASGLSSVRYLAVRYGNVLESRGSIIPLFKFQAENANYLTVTDPEMTRFVMTLDDSVNLINAAIEHAKNGEITIPVLPAMRIGDLAEIFSEKYDKQIKIIGRRPGEKKHEDLINESESTRTLKYKEHYVILPAFNELDGAKFSYSSSDDVMTKDQLREHLTKLGIFEKPLSEFSGQKIEEINTKKQK